MSKYWDATWGYWVTLPNPLLRESWLPHSKPCPTGSLKISFIISTHAMSDQQSKKPAALLGEGPHPWRNSSAQLLLQQLLVSGEIPGSGMPPKEVWETYCQARPEFKGFQYKKFPARLRSMRQQVHASSQRSVIENVAFLHDRELFPVSEVTNRGVPRWQGSPAERHLKADITAKIHERMTPQEFRTTRKEYLEFSLEVFRKHIHQEVRMKKYISQYHNCKI